MNRTIAIDHAATLGFERDGATRQRRGFSWLAATVAGALLLSSPAAAETKVPSAVSQEILIKTSLLTLNDANITGNYVVLHAKLAKTFREQFSPDRLKQSFKPFADKKVDWEIVAAKSPIATTEARIDERGALVLHGYFDVAPSRVAYELDFVLSEGEWKAIKLNVNVKPANQNSFPPIGRWACLRRVCPHRRSGWRFGLPPPAVGHGTGRGG